MNELVIFIASAGRRPYLVRWFKDALRLNDLEGLIIVADADPLAASQAYADSFIVAPEVNSPGYSLWLADVVEQHQVDVALSVNDFELSVWAHFDSEDPRWQRLVRLESAMQSAVEDKLQMYRVLSAAGIQTPETYSVAESASVPYRGDLIVKGRFGSGSKGLRRCSTATLGAAIGSASSEVTHPSGERPTDAKDAEVLLVVQEAVSGVEYGIDVIASLDGEFQTVLARRKIAMRGGETDKATTVDPGPFMALGAQLHALLRHRGPVDVDVIRDANGGLWVIDINPRFGGGYPFSHAAGANIPASLLAWRSALPIREEWVSSKVQTTAAKYIDIVSLPNA